MWRKFTVYGLRFSKTSFWNRMNTGFLDPAVATVPTACGIETLFIKICWAIIVPVVATVPTACGIETLFRSHGNGTCSMQVATVPTACGIETKTISGSAMS